MNNELLASFLEAEIGANCVVKETIDDVVELDDQESVKPKLVFSCTI